jgi:hypothetical protein
VELLQEWFDLWLMRSRASKAMDAALVLITVILVLILTWPSVGTDDRVEKVAAATLSVMDRGASLAPFDDGDPASVKAWRTRRRKAAFTAKAVLSAQNHLGNLRRTTANVMIVHRFLRNTFEARQMRPHDIAAQLPLCVNFFFIPTRAALTGAQVWTTKVVIERVSAMKEALKSVPSVAQA